MYDVYSFTVCPYLGLRSSRSGAKNRFTMAKSSLAELESSEDNNALLIPLNSSLYVPGNIVDKKKVIVELGTGYFAEKSVDDASAMIDRKVCILFITLSPPLC